MSREPSTLERLRQMLAQFQEHCAISDDCSSRREVERDDAIPTDPTESHGLCTVEVRV